VVGTGRDVVDDDGTVGGADGRVGSDVETGNVVVVVACGPVANLMFT
jgi:hypothetical protein